MLEWFTEYWYIFILFLIAVFILNAVLSGIKAFISDKSKKAIDRLGDVYARWRKKPQIKEQIENLIQDYKSIIKDKDSITSKYNIVFVDSIINDDIDFSYFKVPKNGTKEEMSKILLHQLPPVLSYKRERLLFEHSLRISFFDKLTFNLAQKSNPDYAYKILDRIQTDKRDKEYEIIENILNDNEKFELMKAEARRRIYRLAGKSPEYWEVKEFSKFVRKLHKGLFKIILIGSKVKQAYIKYATEFIKNHKYEGLYCLANSQWILTLGEVKRDVEKKFGNLLKVVEDDKYSWLSEETNKKSMKRITIFEKVK